MAVAMNDDTELLLEKLINCGPQNGRADADLARNLVVDLSEYASRDLSIIQYELYLSRILGDKGIIVFGRNVGHEKGFEDAKKSTLDVLKTLLDKDASKINKYAEEIRKYSLFLYNVDKSAKVRVCSLDVFCTVLEKCQTQISIEDFNIDQFLERLCCDIRTPKGSLVLHQQLRTLGILSFCFPERMQVHSKLILKILKDQLIKHTGKTPELNILSGVLKGLSLYLHNFPQGMDDEPTLYSQLYQHIHKVINPDLNLPRREAQRAALELISKHGAKFASQLYERYDTIFQWLIKWCGSKNRDDQKAAVLAMDTFILVVANMLELQAGENKGSIVFRYLLKKYNSILENGYSTTQVSLAVKGYALLSGACKVFLSTVEVHSMFSQVLTASQHSFYQYVCVLL